MPMPTVEEKKAKTAPIAIVGASYAGLALANALHRRGIPYVVFERRTPPFTHVAGAAKFDVPSWDAVAEALALGAGATDRGSDGPTRADVVDALLARVRGRVVAARRVVALEREADRLYHRPRRPGAGAAGAGDDRRGPFAAVVGADGVRSAVRARGLPGTYLIGDARWAGDRWYDLGLRRIRRGADVALADGAALGGWAWAEAGRGRERDACASGRVAVAGAATRNAFCAWELSRRRKRRRFLVAAAILAAVMLTFQPECLSLGRSAIYAFVLLALPVAHWFTDEYTRSGLFSHYAEGFPLIVPLS